MTKKQTIEIFDSTLRDGAQGEGINFSVEDKLAIVEALDRFGVHKIEAGNPGSNPKDLEFFARAKELSLKNAKLVAFGSTRRKNISCGDDANILGLLKADTDYVAIFGKSWDLHVTDILNTTLQENLNMIRDTMRFFVDQGKEVCFDAEHFFDGYKHNPSYAFASLSAAVEGGATTLALCDTNGGCSPDEIYEICCKVVKAYPSAMIGIHCHNDSGFAVANSVAAVKAGIRQVQGTFVGFGERTGNANLSSIIPYLQVKLGFACTKKLDLLTETAHSVAEIANIVLENNMPYVGTSAFTHKAGMHADGVLKSSISFEHMEPSLVGNDRRFLLSEIAGRNAVVTKVQKFFPELTKDSPEIALILNSLKTMEHKGYQFESAEASFMLIVYKALGLFQPSFELVSYKLMSEFPSIEKVTANAIVKVRVNEETEIACSEGEGPVNAMDLALRKALEVFYPKIRNMSLIDYKVRVLNGDSATAATVRVLITSTDGKEVWGTVGVSKDIMKASYKALLDSIEYKLLKDKTKKKQ